MTTKDTGGSAFPQIETCEAWAGNGESGYQAYGDVRASGGMTLRDWFAGKAMQGYCAREDSIQIEAQAIAADAYRIADAMIQARGDS